MTDITRRELLKVASVTPLLPLISKEIPQFYFKVTGENLYSARSLILLQVKYTLNKWTYPKIGKLFVFSTIEQAKSFLSFEERIFKCEVKCPMIAQSFCSAGGIDEQTRFWENKLDDKYIKPAILGTIYCDAVKLIEEII